MAKFKTKYQEIWWQMFDWNFFKNIFSILWKTRKSTILNEFFQNFKLLILEIFVAEISNKHFCKLDKILRNFPSWHVFVFVTVFKKFRFEICNFKHWSFNEKATRCDQGYRKYYFDNILAKNTVILLLFSKINNCKTFVSKINYCKSCNNFTIYFTIIWLYITIIWLLKQFLPTKVPCYNGEIEWPPHAVVTMHVANEFVSTDATQFFWLTTQFVIEELFLRLNK